MGQLQKLNGDPPPLVINPQERLHLTPARISSLSPFAEGAFP